MASGNTLSQKSNPFPGLRPFTPEESSFFFGRDNDIEEILGKLLKNRFVAITGPSGSGKSSLIQCGLLPKIRDRSVKEPSVWRIISLRPGSDPIDNLTDACVDILSAYGIKNNGRDTVRSNLRSNYNGIATALKDLTGKKDEKILLVVDQFEELFGPDETEKRGKSETDRDLFINLLTHSVQVMEQNIFTVVSMRSDIISECAQYKDLTNLINKSNYLVPGMTSDSYREVIESPLKVAGVKIEQELVETILNELGEGIGQLPVLQHALMRTWTRWQELGQPERPIGITDYKSIGSLGEAMSRHADEIFEKLDQEEKKICEQLFKLITGKGSDNRGVRRQAKVITIRSAIRCSEEELIKVIDKFRDPSGSFLTPQHYVALSDDSVIDLSHESMIFLWERLKKWVDEEASSVQMYLRLSELSAMYQQGKTGLMKNPDLQIAINWREQNRPSLTWAQRYNPAFERAMVYLRTSEQAYIESEENKKNLNEARINRIRVITRLMGGIVILATLITAIAFMQKISSDKRRKAAEKQEEVSEQYAAILLKKSIESDSIATVATRNEMAAFQSKEISDSHRLVAERNALQAKREKILALEISDSVLEAKIRAEANTREALEQNAEAQRLRMISVAKSMSLRSLQFQAQKDLQTLLAYQAYLFNKKNNGHPNDADIYLGLYNVAKRYGNINYKIFTGHTGEIKGLAFVPGKSEFFTSGSDGKLLKWNLDNFKQNVQIMYSDSEIIDVIAISPDAEWLACGVQNATIKMIPLKGNNPGYELKGHSEKIKSLIFSFDGKYLYSAALDGKVLKWDLSARTSLDISTGEMKVTSIDLSSDNRYLAGLNDDGRVLIWDPESYTGRFTIGSSGREIRSIRFKPDEYLLAVGYTDGLIELWDIEARTKISEIPAHKEEINNIRFNSKLSQMATASSDGTLKIWDTNNFANPPVTFDDNEGLVAAIEFSPDGNMILTGTFNGVNNLVGRPTLADNLASDVCSIVSRNFSAEEWLAYVGKDIEYELTCPDAEYEIKVKEIR